MYIPPFNEIHVNFRGLTNDKLTTEMYLIAHEYPARRPLYGQELFETPIAFGGQDVCMSYLHLVTAPGWQKASLRSREMCARIWPVVKAIEHGVVGPGRH